MKFHYHIDNSMTVYKNPVESTMYLEALSLCKLKEMSSAFLVNMPRDELTTVNELIIANNAMMFAGLPRAERTRIMYLMYLVKLAICDSGHIDKKVENDGDELM